MIRARVLICFGIRLRGHGIEEMIKKFDQCIWINVRSQHCVFDPRLRRKEEFLIYVMVLA
jgi:hypothetical protein